MGFSNPLGLLALAAVPALAGLIWLAIQRRNRSATRFAAADMLDSILPRSGWRQWVPPTLIVVAVTAGAIAVARPTWRTKVPREQATLMLALDISLSMTATDVDPDRLTAAKEAAEEVLETLPKEMRAGVVAFAANATVVAPPSRDRAAAVDAVRALRLDRGTAVGNAILASLEALLESESADGDFPPPDDNTEPGQVPPRAIVVLSDGDTVTGVDPLEAAEQAAQDDVPVYTVAFGTGDATIEIDGELIPVSVDETELREIADATGGEFFQAFDAETLERIFSDIGSRVGLEEKAIDLTAWFAGAAAVLLVGALAASLLWFGRLL